uniref:Ribonuclease H-like domain-containing protein n=1 Tax=Tanacetum cinerariifolium TaxID=118510 RepID=A0A699PWY3_TANCI|nr:ribonuclease H-like domain-containing protein [Tanacetum cinerariifolium]
MVSSVKLPILKKGEYILLTMKMEQYLVHIDYAIWEVIMNGNGVVQMTKYEAEGLDKGYDRFQRLLSLLEIHGAETKATFCEFEDDLEEPLISAS